MKRFFVVVVVSAVAGVVGHAQQQSTASTTPTLAQLQREAAALQGSTPPSATMVPVVLKDVEALGQEVDREFANMTTGFKSLPARVAGATSFDEAKVILADARERSWRYTEATRRYHSERKKTNDAQLETGRNRVALGEKELRRVDADSNRVSAEERSFGDMLTAAEREAELFSAQTPESIDISRARQLGFQIDTMKRAISKIQERRERLDHDGRQLASDRLDAAREAVNWTQRAIYLDAIDGSSVEETAALREMFLDYLEDDARLRWMRASDASDAARATRSGYSPEPLKVVNSIGVITSVREERDRSDRAKYTQCLKAGTPARECVQAMSGIR